MSDSPHVPAFKEPGLTQYLGSLSRWLRQEFQSRPPSSQSRTMFLTSPNGSVFEVKVSDAGVISATQVSG